jgi:ABC-type polysaccharide/polyol phosphate export permease
MGKTASDLTTAIRAWPIWWRLGIQDVRRGFQRSTFGVSWIFVNFAVTILAVGIVYGALLGQQAKNFLPFLAAGLVVWTYLTSSIVEGSNAFVASEGYIKQIGISPFIYVLRFFVSISFKMFITLLAYLVVAVMVGVNLHVGVIWALPGLLLICATALLLITIFAHLNARFRDAGHLASLSLQVIFFITPVLWPRELLRGRSLSLIVDLNPFYHLLEIVRQPLLYSHPASMINYQAVGLLLIGLTFVAWVLTWRFHRRLAYLL